MDQIIFAIVDKLNQHLPNLDVHITLNLVIDCHYAFNGEIRFPVDAPGGVPFRVSTYHIHIGLINNNIGMVFPDRPNKFFMFSNINTLIDCLQSLLAFINLHMDIVCDDFNFIENYPGVRVR